MRWIRKVVLLLLSEAVFPTLEVGTWQILASHNTLPCEEAGHTI